MFKETVEKTYLPVVNECLNSTLFNLIETPMNSIDPENEQVYMMEDPTMRANPTNTPWQLFLTITRNQVGTISCRYDLMVYLSKAIDIKDIVATLEHDYLNSPSLTMPNNNYQLSLNTSTEREHLRQYTQGMTGIIQQVYITEKNPDNYANLIDHLVDYF